MKRSVVALAVVVSIGVGGATVAFASEKPPLTPGSARQVAALVKASVRQTSITSAVAETITASAADSPQRLFPDMGFGGCAGGTICTFGARSARSSIVLFGDSHTMMWLPALDEQAKAHHYKIVLIWGPGRCSPALLPEPYSYSGTLDTGCDAWRQNALHVMKRLAPKLVLVGERTTQIYSEPSHELFTNAQWQSALERSIRQLQTISHAVAVIEDVPAFSVTPQQCLAAYPTDVQHECAVPYPNKADPGHQVAEALAARATGAGFISTIPWLCTTSCSPVIGNVIAYYDQGHVSSTYAQFLSDVMWNSVSRYL